MIEPACKSLDVQPDEFSNFVCEHQTSPEHRDYILDVLETVSSESTLSALCSDQRVIQVLRKWLGDSSSTQDIVRILKILNRFSFSFQDLHKSRLGRVVKRLHGASDPAIVQETRLLLDRWTDLISAESKKESLRKRQSKCENLPKSKKKVSFAPDDKLCEIRYFDLDVPHNESPDPVSPETLKDPVVVSLEPATRSLVSPRSTLVNNPFIFPRSGPRIDAKILEILDSVDLSQLKDLPS